MSTAPPVPARTGMRPAQFLRALHSEPRAWARDEILATFGISALRTALSSGVASRILPGIYCGQRWESHFATRVEAASLWSAPTGLIGGTSALWVHGVRAREPRTVTVIEPRPMHVEVPTWVRVRRSSTPVKTVRVDRVRAVPVADALMHAWEESRRQDRIGMVADVVRTGQVSVPHLQARLQRYPQLRGRRGLRRVLTELELGPQSFLEHRAMTTAFRGPEFRGFTRQAEVRAGTMRYVLDMLHRQAKVAVELDGRQFHGSDDARRRDLERDAYLAAMGITTIRFTYEDIMHRPQWCRRRVLDALRARGC